jgi:hypothetical protein
MRKSEELYGIQKTQRFFLRFKYYMLRKTPKYPIEKI